MIVSTNCKKGSAWHAWQLYGKAWRIENPRGDIERGVEWFATLPGWPPQSYGARRRAFIEGSILEGRK